MPDFVRSIPLIGTPAAVITWILLLICLALTLRAPIRARRWAIIALCVGGGVALTTIAYVTPVYGFDIPPEQLPLLFVVAMLMLFVQMCVSISTLFLRRGRTVSVLCTMVILLCCSLVGNQAFGMFIDVASLLPNDSYQEAQEKDIPPVTPADESVPVDAWKPSKNLLHEGTRVSMRVPAEHSHFLGEAADVYLPPAWFSTPRPQLPVLVLMHGTPGANAQWFDQADALHPVIAYQKSHRGLAPIVVSVDATGGWFEDPLCVDGPRAKVMTYLTQDVPKWLVNRLGANPDQATWTIGGLSYGGTCATQVITNSPGSYGAFLNYSGELNVNNGEGHQSTVQKFFAGSEQKYVEHNPSDKLKKAIREKNTVYAHLTGRFVAGANDRQSLDDLRTLNKLCVDAGIASTFRSVPGGHDFTVWRTALAQDFPFIVRHGGLPHS